MTARLVTRDGLGWPATALLSFALASLSVAVADPPVVRVCAAGASVAAIVAEAILRRRTEVVSLAPSAVVIEAGTRTAVLPYDDVRRVTCDWRGTYGTVLTLHWDGGTYLEIPVARSTMEFRNSLGERLAGSQSELKATSSAVALGALGLRTAL